MTQVYVPDIGSIIECADHWTFVLYNESRNDGVAEITGYKKSGSYTSWQDYGKPYGVVTLPAGTKLRVDRVYIRQGLSEYSSLTFVVQETSDERFYVTGPKGKKKLKKARFWAKLADINSGNWNLISDPSADPEET